jgi:hypothetical protein
MPTGARAATGSHRGHSDRPARPEQGQPPGTSSGWPAGGPACSRPIGPWGSSAPRGTPTAFPSLARESLVLRPEGRVNLTVATAGGATHRPAVRRPDPSVLLAGAPTRISRSSRVGPSGQLFTVGLHGVAVKATFLLARRVCPAHAGWNYLHGISGDEASLGPSAPGCPPVRCTATGGYGAQVRGLLPGCAVLYSPRAGGLARPGTIAGALARQEAPACLSARRGDHSAGDRGEGR